MGFHTKYSRELTGMKLLFSMAGSIVHKSVLHCSVINHLDTNNVPTDWRNILQNGFIGIDLVSNQV